MNTPREEFESSGTHESQASEFLNSQAAEAPVNCQIPKDTRSEGQANPLTADEKSIAMFCHLIGLGNFIFPLFGVACTAFLWLSKRDSSAFIDQSGREAVNFQIILCVPALLFMAGSHFAPLISVFMMIPFLLVLIPLSIVALVLIIQAATKASRGEVYKYPHVPRLIE